MAITGRWYNDERTIYTITFAGTWTVQMYQEQFAVATQQLETQSHPVDVILDLVQSGLPPLKIYNEANATLSQRSKNLRLTVIVVPNGIIRNVVAIGIRTTRDKSVRVEVAPTHAEALGAITRFGLEAERAKNASSSVADAAFRE